MLISFAFYRGAEKSLGRPGRKQARKDVSDARDFNNIETRAVIKLFFPVRQGAGKEFHSILTETLACNLPDWDKELSTPSVDSTSLYLTLKHLELYSHINNFNIIHLKFSPKTSSFYIKTLCIQPADYEDAYSLRELSSSQ